MKKNFLALMAALTLPMAGLHGADADKMDPELRSKAQRAVDAGLHYLRNNQADDGSWSDSVGVTALGLRAFLESHRGYGERDGAFITRPIAFLLAHVNPDGSISETNQNRNYNTAVSLTALAATGNDEYDEVIRGGQNFLKGLQIDEEEGYESDHAYYGGIGYGGDERPDLSNAYMALEGLRASSMDPEDPVWDKALTFVSRSQNRSESNDQEWAGNDGGFTYMPGYSPHKGTDSYGGMTAAGLLSLLFAGADKDDPRVQAAYDWIRDNYTLEKNPGATDGVQGLYYYYNVFSKAMSAYGDPTVTDTDGTEHNWREDIARKLLSLQREDGSWVNPDSPRWWEGNPELVTAWSVIALNAALQ
ncbi:prenyltransferase/squalene oxidase repeat-containing protein [Lentisalinibacter salinarum]|uniref:prenyltransferase/squalene oxidase repeat-containing protein n=1 Tax=Lentisalinibacter salinarum TaxID=2992239 RepID=UPI0038630D17